MSIQAVLPNLQQFGDITGGLAGSWPLLPEVAHTTELLSLSVFELVSDLARSWPLQGGLERQLSEAARAIDSFDYLVEKRRPARDEPKKNLGAIQLLDTWLSVEDSDSQRDEWRRLRTALDEDRPADRKLFA